MLVDAEASSRELRQAKVCMIEHKQASASPKKQAPSASKPQTILLGSYSKFRPAVTGSSFSPDEQQQLYIGPAGLAGKGKGL